MIIKYNFEKIVSLVKKQKPIYLQSNINDPIDQINKKRITLLKRHHPDVLIAKGQPLEFVEKNNHYVKMINKSWEYIKKNHNK